MKFFSRLNNFPGALNLQKTALNAKKAKIPTPTATGAMKNEPPSSSVCLIVGVTDGKVVSIEGAKDGDAVSIEGPNDGDNVSIEGLDVGDSVLIVGLNEGDSVPIEGLDDGETVCIEGFDVGDTVSKGVGNWVPPLGEMLVDTREEVAVHSTNSVPTCCCSFPRSTATSRVAAFKSKSSSRN